MSQGGRYRHHVYVVELSDRVWNEPSFRKANPDYQLSKPLVYVGMSTIDKANATTYCLKNFRFRETWM